MTRARGGSATAWVTGVCGHAVRCAWLLALTVLAACSGATPTLVYPDETPDDLRQLAADTFEQFVAALPGQAGCIGEVGVQGAWELDDRARYVPDDRTITLRVPATAPQLQVSLVHELAHHVESACASHRDLRSTFATAQGHPPAAAWSDGADWEHTPSEQYATAMVELVLGRSDRHAAIVVTPAARTALRRWARDG